MDPNTPIRRLGRRVAPFGAACAAVLLIAGAGLAQSPAVPDASPSPSAGATTGCDLRSQVTLRGVERRVQRRVERWSARGWPGQRGGSERRGDRRIPVLGNQGSTVIVRTPTVTAISGSVVTLTTPDGWTRDIDTTAVPITRDGTTITLADLAVGDRVRVTQERAEDGTWTVTGLQVALDAASGIIATTAPDGFTITQTDGTAQVVRVSDATTWCTLRGAGGSLETLVVGRRVAVQGVRAEDGAIDATRVTTSGRRSIRPTVPTPSVSPDGSEPPAA